MLPKDASQLSFKKWTIDGVHKAFALKRVRELSALTEWLDVKTLPNDEDKVFLKRIQTMMAEKIAAWSEEDLKMKFISHLLLVVDFDQTDDYRSFFEATLKASINNHTFTAKADMTVATGIAEPQVPFFFMQEYKKERGSDNDPLAQVLGAMVVAQHLNNAPHRPMYGCYVIGRNWFFVVLEGRNYAVSQEYSALRDDLFTIVEILRKLKIFIAEQLQTLSMEGF
jgi:hypothetical protein